MIIQEPETNVSAIPEEETEIIIKVNVQKQISNKTDEPIIKKAEVSKSINKIYIDLNNIEILNMTNEVKKCAGSSLIAVFYL